MHQPSEPVQILHLLEFYVGWPQICVFAGPISCWTLMKFLHTRGNEHADEASKSNKIVIKKGFVHSIVLA